MELWESEIVSLRESGLSWRTLAGEIRRRYPDLAAGCDDLQLRSKARNAWKKAERHRRGLKGSLTGPRKPLAPVRSEGKPTDSALMDALNGVRAAVAVSGYANSIYDDALSDWHRTEIPAFTGTGNHSSTARAARTEVVWTNYEPHPNLLTSEATA